MTIERTTHPDTDALTWTITIPRNEFNAVRLTDSDRLLLHETSEPECTIADTLLGLELITRRIEEQQTA